MQLPEGVTQQDIELQSDCMAEKVTIRLRKEVGGKQLDRRYFQEHPIRQNISLAESEVKEEQDAVLFTVVLNQPQEASVHLRPHFMTKLSFWMPGMVEMMWGRRQWSGM